MTGIPKSDYTEAHLLNANALRDEDGTELRALLESATDRKYPLLTNMRLQQSLIRMDVAVVRLVKDGGAGPIVAAGTLSRIETLGRGCGVIRDVVVGSGHIHHRGNLVASVVGRLLARAQEFAMPTVEANPTALGLMADDVFAAYGYGRSQAVRGILNELR